MIPHILHRVWLGDRPMPPEFERYGDSWREHHPGWEFRLWTDETLGELDCQDLLDRARFPSEASDFLRLELLRRFGGIYVDTDVECLRPIDSLVEGLSAFAFRKESTPPRFEGFIMGAAPDHPAIVAMLDEVRQTVSRPDFTDSFSYVMGTRLIERMTEYPNVAMLGPPEVLNAKARGKQRLPPAEERGETYAIHYRVGSGRETDDPSVELLRLRYTVAKQARQIERLAEIENSAWWRLGGRLAPLLNAARSMQRLASKAVALGRRRGRRPAAS